MDPIKLKRRGPFARWFYAAYKLMRLNEKFRRDAEGREVSVEQAYHDLMADCEKEMTESQRKHFDMAFSYLTEELNKE